MSTINVTVATKKQVMATPVFGIEITLSTASHVVDSKVVSVAPFSATFEGIEDGDYTISAQAINVNGTPAGAQIYDTVSVKAATPDAVNTVTAAEVDVPSSLSITVTA